MIPVYCPLCCDQPFEDQASLYFHLRGVRNNMFCPICSEKFASLEFLVSHLAKKCHGPDSPLLAKRKCLSKINEDPVLLEKKPKLSHPLQSEDRPEHSVGVQSDANTIPEVLHVRLPKNISVGVNTPEAPHLNNTMIQAPGQARLENCTLRSSETFPKSPTNSYAVARKMPQGTRKLISNSDIQDSSVNTTAVLSPGIMKRPKAFSNNPSWAQYKSQSIQFREIQPISAINNSPLANMEYVANKHLNANTSKANTSGMLLKCTPSYKIILPFPPAQGMQPAMRTTKPNITNLPEPPKSLNSAFPKNTVGEAGISGNKFNTTLESRIGTTPSEVLNSKPNNNKSLTEASKPVSNKGKSLQNGMSFLKGKSKQEVKKLSVEGNEADVSRSTSETNNSLKDKPETKVETHGKVDENDDTTDEEYTCSACNIRFTSICEHIKQYHNGEEVVVEVPEDELKEEVRAYQNDQESPVSEAKRKTALNAHMPQDSKSPLKKSASGSKTGSAKKQNKSGVKPDLTSRPKSNIDQSNQPVSCERQSDAAAATNQFPKVNRSKGKWVLTNSGKRSFFQYIYNPNKNLLLARELKSNKEPHPVFGLTIQTLFENPKINVVEITNKPNTPLFTDRVVDLTGPIPMYVTERSVESESETVLGGRASYVIGDSVPTSDRAAVPRTSKVIAVMKVVLASDRKLTLENIVFKEKPTNEQMIPFLEDVQRPELPLLKGAKMLKWRCLKCLATTWKFPLTNDSHCCFSCHLCNKPFQGTQELRAHMSLHIKESERLCGTCHEGLACEGLVPQQQDKCRQHIPCAECRLFVRQDKMPQHKFMHLNKPEETFYCNVCESVSPAWEPPKTEEKKAPAPPPVRLVTKHSCAKCGKKFYSRSALAHHGLDHQQNSLQYPCNYCPKKFIMQKDKFPAKTEKVMPSPYIQKIRHEKIHTRSRSYRCAGCPKTFRSEWHFREHAASCHRFEVTTRAAPPVYACDKCPRMFGRRAALVKHTADHHPS